MYNVKKRDGKIADFDLKKISDAITMAFEAQDKEYNENIKKGWGVFAEYSIKNLEAVRYIIQLIENK